MRLAIPFCLLPLPAAAHVGHLGEFAGHDHWVAGAAIGLAAGIGLWQAAKGRRRRDPEPEGESEGGEAQERPS